MSLAETTPTDRVSLEIPLDAAHILIARQFARGVARSLALGEETAEALLLTLTEICSEAIERRREGRIVISVSSDTDPILVNVVATGLPSGEHHSNTTDVTYRRTLIKALVSEATFVEEQDRLTVMFTL